MRICFDLDGVLANCERECTKVVRALYKPDLPEDYEQAVWSYRDILTDVEWDGAFKFTLQIDNFWTNLLPYHENVEPLREYIRAHGADDVYFLTARPNCVGGSAKTMTSLWMMDNGLPFHNLTVVDGPSQKRALLQELGIQLFLDDYAPTVRGCQGLPGLRAYVLDRKYNRDAADLPRVYSVAEFLVEVELGQ